MASPEFDRFASDYDAALNRGISLSGERKDYFIARRVDWTKRCLVEKQESRSKNQEGWRVMDYGCGMGSAFPKLRETFEAERVVGVDISTAELALARKDHPWAEVYTSESMPADLKVDIAYSNGTFHHIPPAQRATALAFIFHRLNPGGYFALWENNPWNPGTRWVMSRIPFDRDAITLSAMEARRRVRAAGFEVLRTDFLFIFPKMLAPLRAAEPWLSRLPLGAQYQVLCRKR